MNRAAYTDRVLACLKRLTRGERSAIRAELEAHMEDHMLALMELGYDEALAEERMLQHMGDPAEVGRELNRQYSLLWLWAMQLAKVLTICFAILMLLPAARQLTGTVVPNLMARIYPLHELNLENLAYGYSAEAGYDRFAEAVMKTDQRQKSGDVTFYVYQSGLKDPEAEETTGWIAVSMYADNLFAAPPRLSGYLLSDLTGDCTITRLGFGNCFLVQREVTRGECFRFDYEEHGHTYDFTVELPWKEAEP